VRRRRRGGPAGGSAARGRIPRGCRGSRRAPDAAARPPWAQASPGGRGRTRGAEPRQAGGAAAEPVPYHREPVRARPGDDRDEVTERAAATRLRSAGRRLATWPRGGGQRGAPRVRVTSLEKLLAGEKVLQLLLDVLRRDEEQLVAGLQRVL